MVSFRRKSRSRGLEFREGFFLERVDDILLRIGKVRE